MSILQLLAEKESSLLKRWLDHVFSEFHPEAVRFLKGKDRFANPLGHGFSEGLQQLLSFIRAEEPGDAGPTMEQLMKMRAVQSELSPGAALSFIFALKDIIRQECRQEWSPELDREWPEVERRIDRLALIGFDQYMAGRELIYQVRIRELESGRHLITDRAKCASAMMREDIKRLKTGKEGQP